MELSQTSKPGEWTVLRINFPGYDIAPIGVILRDATRDRLQVKLREGWWHKYSENEEAEIWAGLADDIRDQALKMGSQKYLDWFEASGPHVLQIAPRKTILFQDLAETLEALYKAEVERLENIPSAIEAPVSYFDQFFTRLRNASRGIQELPLRYRLATCLFIAVCLCVQQRMFYMTARFSPPESQPVALPPIPSLTPYIALTLGSDVPTIVRPNLHAKPRIRRALPVLLPITANAHIQAAKIDRIPAPQIPLNFRPVTLAPLSELPQSAPEYHQRSRFLHIISAIGHSFKDSPKPAIPLAAPSSAQ